ncbi:MAG: Hsp20/alpha crystallin family protein [Hyphomicrobiales bacterium]
MSNMRSLMDRFFNDSVLRFPGFRSEELTAPSLGLDVYETGNDYVVKAQVPGVDPKDIDINIEDDVLTIKGEFRHQDEVSEDQYLRRELRYGNFERSLRLPPTVDPEKAQAKFENGELKLTLPKRPEARSRSIKITPQGVIAGPSDGQGSQQ